MEAERTEKDEFIGKLFIIITYFIWGVQSLYWKQFMWVPLVDILIYRVIWSFVFLLVITVKNKRINLFINILKKKKVLKKIIGASLLILANWTLNVYAAYSNQVVEASLGNFITPIVTVTMGIVIFKDRLQNYHKLSFSLACLGLAIMIISMGKIPLIAILITLSFSGYSLLKKIIDIDSIMSITIEMLVLAGVMIIYVFFSNKDLIITFQTYSFFQKLLIMTTGLFTIIPLFMFSYGVSRVSFSKIGFIQYLAPTISLIIGVVILNERFSFIHSISFGLIWISIGIFIFNDLLKK